MYDTYRRGLTENHVTLLENESSVFSVRGMKVALYGYELKREYYDRFAHMELPLSEITDVFPAPAEDAYNILLAHYPKIFSDVCQVEARSDSLRALSRWSRTDWKKTAADRK